MENSETQTQNTEQGQMESNPRSLHTPGPWRVIRDAGHPSNARVTSDSRRHIAKVYAESVDGDLGCNANARVIAAAPELLAACKLGLKEVNGKEFVAGCVNDSISPELRRLWEVRRVITSAIAKAEGAPSVPVATDSSTTSY